MPSVSNTRAHALAIAAASWIALLLASNAEAKARAKAAPTSLRGNTLKVQVDKSHAAPNARPRCA